MKWIRNIKTKAIKRSSAATDAQNYGSNSSANYPQTRCNHNWLISFVSLPHYILISHQLAINLDSQVFYWISSSTTDSSGKFRFRGHLFAGENLFIAFSLRHCQHLSHFTISPTANQHYSLKFLRSLPLSTILGHFADFPPLQDSLPFLPSAPDQFGYYICSELATARRHSTRMIVPLQPALAACQSSGNRIAGEFIFICFAFPQDLCTISH